MLEAAVPSPNTLLVVEPMALLKPGLWPNDAVEPKAGELPKAGGLPNTGALPKLPGGKNKQTTAPAYCLILMMLQIPVEPAVQRVVSLLRSRKVTSIKSARLSERNRPKHGDI